MWFSSRAPDYLAWSPEFEPQNCKKKKKKINIEKETNHTLEEIKRIIRG
jgi:hypothetical protein